MDIGEMGSHQQSIQLNSIILEACYYNVLGIVYKTKDFFAKVICHAIIRFVKTRCDCCILHGNLSGNDGQPL